MFWVPGHFPDYAVMPGVLIVEALAQVGAVALLSLPENQGKHRVLRRHRQGALQAAGASRATRCASSATITQARADRSASATRSAFVGRRARLLGRADVRDKIAGRRGVPSRHLRGPTSLRSALPTTTESDRRTMGLLRSASDQTAAPCSAWSASATWDCRSPSRWPRPGTASSASTSPPRRSRRVNAGTSYIPDVPTDGARGARRAPASSRRRPTSPRRPSATPIAICVPTPLNEMKEPDTSYMEAAAAADRAVPARRTCSSRSSPPRTPAPPRRSSSRSSRPAA